MIAAGLAPVMLAACAPTVIPAGPQVVTPHLTATSYVAADGTTLPLSLWPAVHAHPKAILLGLHGFGDYRDAFQEPAEIWAKSDITTYAYDQRGFGKSPTRGRWPGTDTLAADALAVAALIRARHRDVPFYVIGESMGGALALIAADRGLEADGLILSAPALRGRVVLGPAASAALWFFGHTLPWLPAGPTSIDFRPTNNPKALAKLQKDPLMLHQPRVDMAYGLVDLMDISYDAARRIHTPYLMLHGMDDRLVPTSTMRAALEIMPALSASKLAFYEHGSHLLMRDNQGPLIAADIAAWIGNHDAALPSGADAKPAQPKFGALWGSKR
jgi:alpha-beta hydrolase superfamily lysophospholipase